MIIFSSGMISDFSGKWRNCWWKHCRCEQLMSQCRVFGWHQRFQPDMNYWKITH